MNYITYILIILLACVIAYIVYAVGYIRAVAQKSTVLIEKTTPYVDASERRLSILVIGDSLAYGVGATTAAESVPGRLGQFLDASVENYSKSGAIINDGFDQLARAQKKSYDVIYIQLGANDIITLKHMPSSLKLLERLFDEASKKSDHVMYIYAGNIADVPIWNPLLKRVYEYRSKYFHAHVKEIASKKSILYIDLYSQGNIFNSDPDRYYANDMIHLSSDGYAEWFSIIIQSLHTSWKELTH
jgi:lysophospholipase L1-like esterase